MLNQNIPLKNHSNYKIGGPADYYTEVTTKEKLIEVLNEWKNISSENKAVFIFGDGTNILFDDEGFRGLVIKNKIDFIKNEKDSIHVGSGTEVADLVSFYVRNSMSGFEWAGGLPGSVGGAIRGNAGAFGGETKDNLISVESINLEDIAISERNNKECKFEYRSSIFKTKYKNEFILSAKFSFIKGNQNEIKKSTQEKIDFRIDRHPLDYPNAGSVFKNVPVKNVPEVVLEEFEKNIKNDPFPVLPVAKLILGVGMLGEKINDVQVSEKHPNFIVNLGNGKSRDVKKLIEIIKEKVKDKYNIELEEEVLIL